MRAAPRSSVACAAIVIAYAAVAWAAPRPEEAREAARRFRRGNDLYMQGHYTDALQLYQAAYDLIPSANILLNIGLTKEKVFDYEGCSIALRQFLAETTDAERHEQAQKRLEVCRSRTLIPVRVSSMPPSAAVIVDDQGAKKLRGRTPTRLDLAPGTYAITVEAPGYRSQTQEVKAEEGVHPDVDFTLEKLSSLRIEADVSGASVEIDGAAAGPAPFQREVKAGLYQVRVAKAGYRTANREVRVNAGDQISLVLSLFPLPRERRLTIDLKRPTRARVSIDGTDLGEAPLDLKLPSGQHRVEVATAGHLPYASDLRVPDERDVRLRVRLTPRRTTSQWLTFGGIEAAALGALGVSIAFDVLAARDQSSFDHTPTVGLVDRGLSHATVADAMLGVSVATGLAGAIYILATLPRPSTAELVP